MLEIQSSDFKRKFTFLSIKGLFFTTEAHLSSVWETLGVPKTFLILARSTISDWALEYNNLTTSGFFWIVQGWRIRR